jgi:hypothetical protein
LTRLEKIGVCLLTLLQPTEGYTTTTVRFGVLGIQFSRTIEQGDCFLELAKPIVLDTTSSQQIGCWLPLPQLLLNIRKRLLWGRFRPTILGAADVPFFELKLGVFFLDVNDESAGGDTVTRCAALKLCCCLVGFAKVICITVRICQVVVEFGVVRVSPGSPKGQRHRDALRLIGSALGRGLDPRPSGQRRGLDQLKRIRLERFQELPLEQ